MNMPFGMEETKLPYVTRERGEEILGYCQSCRVEDCEMNVDLRSAMGENFPYWSDRFRTVRLTHPVTDRHRHYVYCADYQDPQLSLPNFGTYPDGFEKLTEIVQKWFNS
ncbi:MAG: hypothetical protein R6V53_02205 [Candidatus Woesearchaeota archaeon]